MPWNYSSVMDQIYDVFKLYAEQFANIPMFPVLQCAHYTIMNLKLRMGEGKLTFGPGVCSKTPACDRHAIYVRRPNEKFDSFRCKIGSYV